jgi:hypothetical protein
MSGLAIAWRINGTALGLAEPGEQHRDGGDLVRIAVDGPGCTRHDDEAGLRRIQLRGCVQLQSAAAAEHRTRAFGRHQLHHELAAHRVAARYEHVERRDHVERVEPIEQHNLRMHDVIVDVPRTKD